jgi:hypothetical protein
VCQKTSMLNLRKRLVGQHRPCTAMEFQNHNLSTRPWPLSVHYFRMPRHPTTVTDWPLKISGKNNTTWHGSDLASFHCSTLGFYIASWARCEPLAGDPR